MVHARGIVALVFWLAAALVATASDVTPTPTSPPLAIRAMTYNLRYASDEAPHAWHERRPAMVRVITAADPDVMGTQEGLEAQLDDLSHDLPAYARIGQGREGGTRGEHSAIFYKSERFEALEHGDFWLSDTPEVVGSITWGTTLPRMVSWVRLRERTTGRELLVWCTHFDNAQENARRRSAELIRDRLAKTDPKVPFLLLGDFNCAAGSAAAYTTLTQDAGLTDAWTIAAKHTGEGWNTFHGYNPPRHDGIRIDWILVRGTPTVSQESILCDTPDNRAASDHFAVLAVMRW